MLDLGPPQKATLQGAVPVVPFQDVIALQRVEKGGGLGGPPPVPGLDYTPPQPGQATIPDAATPTGAPAPAAPGTTTAPASGDSVTATLSGSDIAVSSVGGSYERDVPKNRRDDRARRR